MKFVKQVRNGTVIGPLRREFQSSSWDEALTKYEDDGQDRDLHKAGSLLHQKAAQIRGRVKFVYNTSLRATTKLRSLVAMSNVFYLDVTRKADAELQRILESQSTPVQLQLSSIALRLPQGGEYSPDELFQGIVDGCQVPIRVVLTDAAGLGGNAQFSSVDWKDVWFDVNLGVLYTHIEDIWDDCLWNEFVPVVEPSLDVRFESRNPEWRSRLAASRSRHNNLRMYFLHTTGALIRTRQLEADAFLRGRLRATGIKRNDGKKSIALTPMNSSDAEGRTEILVSLYAEEQFYQSLVSVEQEFLAGSTVRQLLASWLSLKQIAELEQSDLQSQSEKKDHGTHDWFSRFVPVLSFVTLERALAKSVGLSFSQSRAIVRFLTFWGKRNQEIWAQPLVPISNDSASLVLAAFEADPARLLDIWLQQLGTDMALRGPAFEQYLREELVGFVEGSALNHFSWVLPSSLKFTPPRGRREEIDLVFCVGDVIVVGEAKCTLIPAEAKQIAMHRRVISEAAEQITRKVQAIKSASAQFREHLSSRGCTVPAHFTVVGAVIVNSPIHVGFPIGEIGIVDLPILRVYFQGSYSDTVVEGSGKQRDIKQYPIYTDAAGAPSALVSYLLHPPQMEAYRQGIRERRTPVGKLLPDEPGWICVDSQFVFDSERYPQANSAK